MLARRFETVLAWLKRHERRLSTLLFVSGFVGDLLTFGLLSLPRVTLLFAVYLTFAASCTILAHAAASRGDGRLARTVRVLAPLFAQFTFGSLLSGFLILYTKSAVLAVSWPFLILLIIIFFGNEAFRNYREHLIFQTLLLYFSLYAFFIFALPLYLGKLGTAIFLSSTALTLLVFMLYLVLLRLIDWRRLKGALRFIAISCVVVTIGIVASYMAGILPPIPLTLKDGGIYHEVVRVPGGYQVQGEARKPWWDPRAQTIHHMPGTPLYAYSAVFAPGAFSAVIVHHWQRYDAVQKEWRDEATIAFSLSGGREGGYRGYSMKYDPAPGKWRVLVETLEGQVIGELPFTVVSTSAIPPLTTQVR